MTSVLEAIRLGDLVVPSGLKDFKQHQYIIPNFQIQQTGSCGNHVLHKDPFSCHQCLVMQQSCCCGNWRRCMCEYACPEGRPDHIRSLYFRDIISLVLLLKSLVFVSLSMAVVHFQLPFIFAEQKRKGEK